MSGSSSWNDSGFAFAPNTNTMDQTTMPSKEAQAAREKTLEIMNALKDGKPGEADAMMGKREAKGTAGIVPLDWVKSKFGGKKKEGKEEKGDGMIR